MKIDKILTTQEPILAQTSFFSDNNAEHTRQRECDLVIEMSIKGDQKLFTYNQPCWFYLKNDTYFLFLWKCNF